MTRTSVSCRPEFAGIPRSRGFTLLEVLVVLVIISMAVAVVAPRLERTYASVVRSGERADVLRQIQRLPLIAREKGGLELAPGDKGLNDLLKLPQGWKVFPVKELKIEASGACRKGVLRIEQEGERVALQIALREPDCGTSYVD